MLSHWSARAMRNIRSAARSAAAVGAGLRDMLPCPPRMPVHNSAGHLRSGACGLTGD